MIQPLVSFNLTPGSSFSHNILVSTPISAILALTRSLQCVQHLYHITFLCFYSFMFCSLFCACFACVIVQTTRRSREIKNKYTRKRISSLARKASGLLPMHIPLCPNNSMIIHFTLLLNCINLMGHLLRIYLVFYPKTLNTGFNLFVGQKCLVAYFGMVI